MSHKIRPATRSRLSWLVPKPFSLVLDMNKTGPVVMWPHAERLDDSTFLRNSKALKTLSWVIDPFGCVLFRMSPEKNLVKEKKVAYPD